MSVKIDATAPPHIFPAIEATSAETYGLEIQMKLFTRIEGQLLPVAVKLNERQVRILAEQLNAALEE